MRYHVKCINNTVQIPLLHKELNDMSTQGLCIVVSNTYIYLVFNGIFSNVQLCYWQAGWLIDWYKMIQQKTAVLWGAEGYSQLPG